jgi:predicted dehydrogenase
MASTAGKRESSRPAETERGKATLMTTQSTIKNQKSKMGIGVLSLAHGHGGVYCSQIVDFDDAELVAVWDDDPERGKAAAEKFGMRYEPEAGGVLSDPRVRAVIVTCETNRHAEVCERAAAAGKDILLQKPMGLSLEDCDRISAAVERHGVRFSMAFQMRCDPVNQRMRELVHSGAIGRVFLMRRRHCIGVMWSESFMRGKTAWHVDRVKNYGMFFDDAVHGTDFIRWMLGDPESVIAEVGNHYFPPEVPEDSGLAIFKYAGNDLLARGAMVDLTNNSITHAGENTSEIYGDKGTIIQNHGDGVSTLLEGQPHPVALKMWTCSVRRWEVFDLPIPKGQGERIAGVARPFVDWLHGRREAIGTLEDGRKSVEMILAAYQSAREGRRVYLGNQVPDGV